MTRVTRDVESNTSIDDLRLVCSVVCLDEHVNINLFQMAAKIMLLNLLAFYI